MRVSHTKVSAAQDTADASLIQPSDWNSDHTLDGLVADDDSRLSDARTPLAHTHDYADPHAHPYSGTAHDHDAAYSATGHTHTHDHDGTYAPTHSHPYAADSHSHSGSEAFPVGSVFLSVVSTNPATLLGYGTWSAFGAGRMLVGNDGGTFGTDEATGGASTHTHAGHSNHVVTQPAAHTDVPTHTHPITDPGHFHDEYRNSATTGGLDGWAAGDTSTNTPLITGYDTGSKVTGISVNAPAGAVASQPHTGTAVDAHSAHDSPSHLPPYIVVRMWKRTA